MKSINTRQNVDIFHIVIFPCPERILQCMKFVPKTLKKGGSTCEMGDIHTTKPSKKDQGKIRPDSPMQFRSMPFKLSYIRIKSVAFSMSPKEGRTCSLDRVNTKGEKRRWIFTNP